MNEGTKTGIFWCVAVVMMAIAAFVAWPTNNTQEDNIAGNLLFEKFTDPLAAASMKIVTFDEEQGQLETFEVRKDRESGQWTIPSRSGYPADGLEQMKDAANALVGLKILDIQTSNAEDHDDLGVAEPKLEDLEIGDEGVGRLVTFKDNDQQTLASLIIGDPTKDDPEKLYVRIPGQDPVYVVKFDESPLTTNFQSWIEDDLLQLSSIDIEDMEIKDYNASINAASQINLTRNYDAKVSMDGPDWTLVSLMQYDETDPLAPPTAVTPAADEKLNKTKLDAIKNALDELKIADVRRKPEGMSATLRANQDLLTDKEAVGSLAQRGFYPIQQGPQYEILSANGELTVGLKDGVQYVMRFGNVAGVSNGQDNGDGSIDSVGGVNRYLLVMTQVDQSKFPAPQLQPVPQTLEDLKALLAPEKEQPKEAEPVPAKENADTEETDVEATDAEKTEADTPPTDAKSDTSQDAPKPADDSEAVDQPAVDATDKPAEPGNDDAAAAESTSEESGETEGAGSGEATGSGEGQVENSDDDAKPAADDEKSAADDETAASEDEKPAADDAKPAADDAKPAADDAKPAADDAKPSEEEKPVELTAEEMQERLEAEQEKITKENQRKMDERKDKLEAANQRVRALNERFADWYYVIPEDTYSKLRISREELFEKPEGDESAAGFDLPGAGGPSFLPNIPGAPGN